MKVVLRLLLVISLLVLHGVATAETAEVSVNLRIVDELGNPLERARWHATFRGSNHEHYSFKTDKEGRVSFVCEAPQRAEFSVNAERLDRCYTTADAFLLERSEEDDGRWKPVEKTLVVKMIRDPIPMFSHEVYEKPIPVFNKALGFDLRLADWVKPYGMGEVADITISVCRSRVYSYGEKVWKVDRVILDCPNEGDGIQVTEADLWSKLRSVHQADVSRPFQRQLVLQRGKNGKDWLLAEQYLIFRTRCTYDDNGTLIGCHYSKLYPSFRVDAKTISIKSITFNPNAMDRNLEPLRLHNLSLREKYSTTRPNDLP